MYDNNVLTIIFVIYFSAANNEVFITRVYVHACMKVKIVKFSKRTDVFGYTVSIAHHIIVFTICNGYGDAYFTKLQFTVKKNNHFITWFLYHSKISKVF